MPQPKIKSENYANFGGMNTKISSYLVEQHEFLDLQNFDFTRPGSLTKRPGTTQYLGHTLDNRITGIFEYEKLNGSSQIIIGSNSGLFWVNGSTFSTISTGFTSILSLSTFVDRLFAFDGATSSAGKWNGS